MFKTSAYPESKNKTANEKRYGIQSNNCVVCGKPTKENIFVHLLTTGEIVNTDANDIPNSQGLFPIGPDCAKLIEPEFLFKV